MIKEYEELEKVSDGIKIMKKKHKVSRNARTGAILRHIIYNSTGFYIPFKIKIKNKWHKSPTAIILALLIKRAYWLGRISKIHEAKNK